MDSNERPRHRITGANGDANIEIAALSGTPDGAYAARHDRTTTSEDAYNLRGPHAIGSSEGRSSMRMNTGKNSLAHHSAIASSVNYY